MMLSTHVAELNQEMQDLPQQLPQKRQECQHIEAILRECGDDITKVRSGLNKTEANLNVLRQKVIDKQSELDQLDSQMQQTLQDLDRFRAEVKQRKQKKAEQKELQKELNELQKVNDTEKPQGTHTIRSDQNQVKEDGNILLVGDAIPMASSAGAIPTQGNILLAGDAIPVDKAVGAIRTEGNEQLDQILLVGNEIPVGIAAGEVPTGGDTEESDQTLLAGNRIPVGSAVGEVPTGGSSQTDDPETPQLLMPGRDFEGLLSDNILPSSRSPGIPDGYLPWHTAVSSAGELSNSDSQTTYDSDTVLSRTEISCLSVAEGSIFSGGQSGGDDELSIADDSWFSVSDSNSEWGSLFTNSSESPTISPHIVPSQELNSQGLC